MDLTWIKRIVRHNLQEFGHQWNICVRIFFLFSRYYPARHSALLQTSVLCSKMVAMFREVFVTSCLSKLCPPESDQHKTQDTPDWSPLLLRDGHQLRKEPGFPLLFNSRGSQDVLQLKVTTLGHMYLGYG